MSEPQKIEDDLNDLFFFFLILLRVVHNVSF